MRTDPSPASPARPTILYLVPDLIGLPGGIARYCRMVALALDGWAELHVVALHDDRKARDGNGPNDHRYSPCGGSRTRFIASSLSALRHAPDVILIGHLNFSPLGWFLAGLAGCRYSVFLYGTDVWTRLAPWRRGGLGRADSLIAISNFTARRAAEVNSLPADRIRILYNCLDPVFTREPSGVLARSRSMLTVARICSFEPFKGHRDVIAVMPALLEEFPDLVYDVVGDGDARRALESMADELGVGSAVVFHGNVSDSELAKRYAEATVFVMPSSVEGFGFVFLEAMAYGTPAVGGNVDATPEVIADGRTGYTVTPTDHVALREAIAAILRDPGVRARMSDAARALAVEKFGFAEFRATLRRYVGALLGSDNAATA